MRNSVFKPRSYDRMVNFCSPKVTFCVNFIPSRCRICRDLRVFIGVKLSLEDLLRVKDLTFRNSGGVRQEGVERKPPSPKKGPIDGTWTRGGCMTGTYCHYQLSILHKC